MRNYAQEGWITQLQGRRVLGHYLVSTTCTFAAGTARPLISIRNPLVQHAQRQRHLHLVRAEIQVAQAAADDAAVSFNAAVNTVAGYTVSYSTGGSAATIVNLMKSGIASAVDAFVDTSSGMTGGTVATTDAAITQCMLSQSVATGTDAQKSASCLWVPTWGPVLLKGDEGVLVQISGALTAPGSVDVFGAIEWLETEPA